MSPPADIRFPLPLSAYTGEEGMGHERVLGHRVTAEPMNLVATAISLIAILHAFSPPG